MEEFVAEFARDLELGTRSVDVRCRRIVSRLCRWAVSQGLPLEREVIFDPGTVEHFCVVALADDRSRATHRSDLRRLGPKLTKKAPWAPPPRPIGLRKVARPYTDAEVDRLVVVAAQQRTPYRRRLARALLALGLGAGLDGRWVGWVTPDDVSRRHDVVEVRVGEPSPRVVVVRGRWEAEVLALASEPSGPYLVGGRARTRSRVTDMAKRLDRPSGHPVFSCPRLRSTWLSDHLAAGTRLPELCAAAGLSGFEVLSDLLAHVAPLDETASRLLLRGVG